jgi:hypothetical protein
VGGGGEVGVGVGGICGVAMAAVKASFGSVECSGSSGGRLDCRGSSE